MKISRLLVLLSFLSVSLIVSPIKNKENIKSNYQPRKTDAPDVTDKVVLRIMNMYDYIYVQENDEDPVDLVDQFTEWCAENTRFKNVEVVYDCTDTNETLLTQLQLGSAYYDLVCPSEYMIQKMIREDLIIPLNRADRDELLSNYDEYASKYIRGRLDEIEVNNAQGETVHVGDYAVGYMWGTLGLLFNGDYNEYYSEHSIEDMDSWNVLYEAGYDGTISIKDSMRDTYAAILMRVYSDELLEYREKYLSDEYPDYGAKEYNADIQEVFNRIDDDTLKEVELALDELKGNIFGLEVDSGKQDIVDGKIGINLAWSGDAVYAMELGEEEDVYLSYAIPLEGSNVWFDGWVMPNCQRSEEQEELAYIFLDYISMPENAAQNMSYTGYTSFIGGEDILDLVRDWYDDRKNEEEEFDPSIEPTEDMQMVDLNYFFNSAYGSPDYVPNPEYYFYAEEYYLWSDEETLSSSVGGAFFCQYPDEETITRCSVMRDFGERNDPVLKMWESFKSNSLPLWAVILLVAEVTIIVTLVTYYFISKSIKKGLRKKRIGHTN